MLKIKRERFEQTGHWFDYELDNGIILHKSEWNGEEYTIKEGNYERRFRPVMVETQEDAWEAIGFEEL